MRSPTHGIFAARGRAVARGRVLQLAPARGGKTTMDPKEARVGFFFSHSTQGLTRSTPSIGAKVSARLV